MELLTSTPLSGRLRLPAQSRLQKVHNVGAALEALKNSKAGLPKTVSVDAK